MKATGVHRDRKNRAAHEAWVKRKKAANIARGKQWYDVQNKEYALIPQVKQ